MSFDMDAYISELKEELKAVKAENKSMREELNAKDKELLEKQFVESAEIKKINEEFAPYKKMGVSAETLNDTLKRSQKGLKEALAEKTKLSEELQQFKDVCGSVEQIKEATKLSEMALNRISEYQNLGTVEQLTELVEQSEKMLPKLEELTTLGEYRKLGSIEDIKALSETAEKLLPTVEVLEEYKKLGSVEQIKEMAQHAEKALEQLKEAQELGKTVKSLIPQLQKMKEMQEYAKKANSVIKQYVETVGSLKKARALAESKKETIKKVNVKEALDVSKKFGCTVESAAKMLKKYGNSLTIKRDDSGKPVKNANGQGIIDKENQQIISMWKDNLYSKLDKESSSGRNLTLEDQYRIGKEAAKEVLKNIKGLKDAVKADKAEEILENKTSGKGEYNQMLNNLLKSQQSSTPVADIEKDTANTISNEDNLVAEYGK